MPRSSAHTPVSAGSWIDDAVRTAAGRCRWQPPTFLRTGASVPGNHAARLIPRIFFQSPILSESYFFSGEPLGLVRSGLLRGALHISADPGEVDSLVVGIAGRNGQVSVYACYGP